MNNTISRQVRFELALFALLQGRTKLDDFELNIVGAEAGEFEVRLLTALLQSGDKRQTIAGLAGVRYMRYEVKYRRALRDLLVAQLKSPDGTVLEYAIRACSSSSVRLFHNRFVRLATDSRANARLAVASTVSVASENAASLRILEKLASDNNGAVRDMACFGVNKYRGRRAERIRILRKRVSDRNYEARCEAIEGLARLRDPLVVPYVLRELRARSIGRLIVLASSEFPHRRFSAPLAKMVRWWDVDEELLLTAIRRCRTSKRE